MTSMASKAPIVKPPSQKRKPADRDYEYHPAPKELARLQELSDSGYRLMSVLLNEAAFLLGGSVSTAQNDWLCRQCGWLKMDKKAGKVIPDENKILRVFKELESLGLVERVMKQVGKRPKRDCIRMTWVPTELIGRNDVVPFGPPEMGVQEHGSSLDPQNQGSATPGNGGSSPPKSGVGGPPEMGGLKEVFKERSEELFKKTPAPPSPTPPQPGAESSPSSPGRGMADEGRGGRLVPCGAADDDERLPNGLKVLPPPLPQSEIAAGIRDMLTKATQPAEARRGVADGAAHRVATKGGAGTPEELQAQVERLRERSRSEAKAADEDAAGQT